VRRTSSDGFRRFVEGRDRLVGKIRIGALNSLCADRYRGRRETYVFTDDDAGLEDLKILLHHYAPGNPMAVARILKLRAPWAGHNRAISIMEEIFTYPGAGGRRRWESSCASLARNGSGSAYGPLRRLI
jgi:hypothetical protein